VRRFALAIILALLTVSAPGAFALVIAEPCMGYEQPGQDDGACPPICVTCGCCAQAVEPVAIVISATPDTPIDDIRTFCPTFRTTSRDICRALHRDPNDLPGFFGPGITGKSLPG
jgi:hypothetical protein